MAAVGVADVMVVRFPDGTIATTETLDVRGGWKMVEFSGYVGNPALGLVDVDVVRLGMIKELRLPVEVGKPEEGRVKTLTLPDGVGKPDVGRDKMLELADRVGKPAVGRKEMLELADREGNAEGAVGAGGKPELGRNEKLMLLVGYRGKPELGPVTGDRRVVEFKEILGVRLGTEYEVMFSVGAMVGPVLDGPKRVERESDELEVTLGSEPLGPEVPTMLGPVLSGTSTDVFVVGIGVGMTERVDETVTVPGLPALVRNLVVVPEVTKTVSVVSSESRPLMVRV